MAWQVLTIAVFTTWVSLGALLGSWLGPVRHCFEAGAFHVQSLYDDHLGKVTPPRLPGETVPTLHRLQ